MTQPHGRLTGGRITLPEDAMDRQWVYRISSPHDGIEALRRLDILPSDVLTRMGIAACGTPAAWYVYAVATSPSDAQTAQVPRALDSVGTTTDLTVEDLLARRLSFFASGPVHAIEIALTVVGFR